MSALSDKGVHSGILVTGGAASGMIFEVFVAEL